MKEALKHRLIGAAVIAAVAVLFLPGFFKDRQAYQVNTESQIPERPRITAVDFNEPELVEDVEPAPAPEAMFAPETGDALPSDTSVATQPTTTDTHLIETPSSVASKVEPATVAEMPLNTKGLPDAWMVQVVSLSNDKAATTLRDQLQHQGHKAFIRSVNNEKGRIHRVFVGPELDKAEALSLKGQLDKQLHVKSIVLPFQP